MTLPLAPELAVAEWFNTPTPISLTELRGRVVMLHAFQMLCPGCVAHGTPQAQRAHNLFPNADLAVIGVHTVFEHHAAMTPVSLEAFIHEYRLTFPIGVDQQGGRADSPSPFAAMRCAARRRRSSSDATAASVTMDSAGRMIWSLAPCWDLCSPSPRQP
jgi:thiol-disulfide isomerase/thioredoxin